MIRARRGTRAAAPGGVDAVPQPETQPGRTWLFTVGGAVATAIPAAPGAALAAVGHPQAIPLLISSGVIGLLSVVVGAVVKIHDNGQRTRRLQIQYESTTALANAMARCLDDTHAAAPDLPPESRTTEAAKVRRAAMQTAAQMMPAMLAALRQQNPDSDA